ncbi:hypothetical protein KR032_003576 [Drosophila birchii]|nr:hypothetical protein KR032_003576 [Drosophila birchii]
MPLSAPLHKLHNLLCVCHIVRYFDYQKTVCHLLCIYNLRFNETTQKFTFGHQIFIYFMYFWSLLSLLSHFALIHCYLIDRGSLYIYALPFFYFLMLRRSMLKTLNEMVRLHSDLQSTMGTLFCVSVKRAFCCSWLISFEVVAVFYWQIMAINNVELLRMNLITYLIGWHFQLLLQVNSYIWLQSIYVVINQVLTARLRYTQRWKMLRNVLKIHYRLREIQRDISHYFSVYIASVIVLISFCFYRSVIFEAGFDWEQSRLVLMSVELWQLRYLANMFFLFGTLITVVWDYKAERDKFLKGLWKSEGISRRIIKCRKSARYLSRCNHTLDIVDMMLLSGNQPCEMICSDVKICEIRIKQDSIFSLEMTYVINHILLLMLNMCLVPLVAYSNGFEFSFELKLFSNNTSPIFESSSIETCKKNFTLDSYVLSLSLSALGE